MCDLPPSNYWRCWPSIPASDAGVAGSSEATRCHVVAVGVSVWMTSGVALQAVASLVEQRVKRNVDRVQDVDTFAVVDCSMAVDYWTAEADRPDGLCFRLETSTSLAEEVEPDCGLYLIRSD